MKRTKTIYNYLASLFLGSALLFASNAASAEALVSFKDGTAQPGIIASWSGSGKKIELTVADGQNAKDIAEAIKDGVERVKVKVRSGKILVKGKKLDDLLKALAEVDMGEGDLGEFAAVSLDSGDGSGSSFRAKLTKSQDNKYFAKAEEVAVAQVGRVIAGKYPQIAIEMRIRRAPLGALGKEIRKGKKLVFYPQLKLKNGLPDLSDETTRMNLAAWYLRKGDEVRIQVGAKQKKGYQIKALRRTP